MKSRSPTVISRSRNRGVPRTQFIVTLTSHGFATKDTKTPRRVRLAAEGGLPRGRFLVFFVTFVAKTVFVPFVANLVFVNVVAQERCVRSRAKATNASRAA